MTVPKGTWLKHKWRFLIVLNKMLINKTYFAIERTQNSKSKLKSTESQLMNWNSIELIFKIVWQWHLKVCTTKNIPLYYSSYYLATTRVLHIRLVPMTLKVWTESTHNDSRKYPLLLHRIHYINSSKTVARISTTAVTSTKFSIQKSIDNGRFPKSNNHKAAINSGTVLLHCSTSTHAHMHIHTPTQLYSNARWCKWWKCKNKHLHTHTPWSLPRES